MKGKRFTLVVLMIFFMLFAFAPAKSPAAPFLGRDVQTLDPGTTSEIEVTPAGGAPTIYEGVTTVVGTATNQYLQLLDLANFTGGKYQFRARFKDASGWPGDWSPLLSAGKPSVLPGNVKVR